MNKFPKYWGHYINIRKHLINHRLIDGHRILDNWYYDLNQNKIIFEGE